MSHYVANLPWTLAEEDEERFRRIFKRSAIFFLIVSLVMPWLPVPKVDRKQAVEIPARLAKLVLEQRQIPKPPPPPPKPVQQEAKKKPEVKPPTEPKTKPPKEVKQAKPEPVPPTKNTEAARAKAARSGLLAFTDELADLRDAQVTTTLQKNVKPGPGVGPGKGPGVGPSTGQAARSLITSNAAGGSGGINTASLSRDTGGGGGLAGRSTTRVTSRVGGGDGDGTGGTVRRGGGKAGRSMEEIRLVFEANKSAIYALHHRALRDDPTLQGKVLLRLVIAASGRVVKCEIVSSELKSPEFERKLSARVMQFDFGAKDVGDTRVDYPLDFLPS